MAIPRLAPWARREVPLRRLSESTLTPASMFELNNSFREMEQLMEQMMGVSNNIEAAKGFNPVLDLHETENEFQISIELPGIEEKDIDINITRDMLTISGEKKDSREQQSKTSYRLERHYGAFSRSISLPRNGVDTNGVKAAYKHGVLTVSLPKTPDYREEARKIPIASEQLAESSSKLES